MSESMVERVGRALAKEEGYAYDPLPYDARARAAIAAMREPTVEMVDEGGVEYNSETPYHAEAYRAMLDEALK